MSEVADVIRPPFRVQIDTDWYVDDLKSVEDCVAAEGALTIAIAAIEIQVEGALERQTRGHSVGETWLYRARAALTHKRLALQHVMRVHSRMRKDAARAFDRNRSRLILEVLREIDPEVFRRGVAEARNRHPDVFSSSRPDPVPQTLE